MIYPRPAPKGASSTALSLRAASPQWTVRRRGLPRYEDRPTRRFSVQWIDRDGHHDEFSRLAPAIPLFEEAFSALGRGTLIPTSQGAMAVEDMTPGTLVQTTSGLAPLVWVGSVTVVPDSPAQDASPMRLFRIPGDAFGLGRPMPDLVLGPGARLLNRGPEMHSRHGADAVLEPIAPMADGTSVIEIRPAAPVTLYHIGFLSHRTVLANGVEVESLHPGGLNLARIDPKVLSLYLSLFPHIRMPEDIGRLCHPRVSPPPADDSHAA